MNRYPSECEDEDRNVVTSFAKKGDPVVAESPAPLSAPVNTTTSTAEGRTLACSTDESCSEDGVKATRIGTGTPIAAQLVGGAAPLSEEAPTQLTKTEQCRKNARDWSESLLARSGWKCGRLVQKIFTDGYDDALVDLLASYEAHRNAATGRPALSEEACKVTFSAGSDKPSSGPVSTVIFTQPAFSEEAERREFEEWAVKIGDPISRTSHYGANRPYDSTFTEWEWRAWLACAKRRAEG